MANVTIEQSGAYNANPTSAHLIELQAPAGASSNTSLSDATKALAVATTSAQGVMSAADKVAVNNIAATAFINALIFG